MTDELKERVKALVVEAGGVPMRENCLGADAFPWGVEIEIDALVKFAQAVARDCVEIAENIDDGQIGSNDGNERAAAAISARYGLED